MDKLQKMKEEAKRTDPVLYELYLLLDSMTPEQLDIAYNEAKEMLKEQEA